MPTATKDAEIKFRTSDELKRQTRRVYDRWGLSLSEAFNLFMRKSVEVGGLPFDLRPEPSPALSGRETLVKKVSIVPLEVIVRNIAAGSFSHHRHHRPSSLDGRPRGRGTLRRPRMRRIEFKRTERRRAVSCKKERAYWRYCHES